MKKIILHVGSGKAGSTSIQQALLLSQSKNKENYAYPVLPHTPGNQVLKYAFCDKGSVPKHIKDKYREKDCQEAIKASFQAQCEGENNIIISSEFLFHSSADEILRFNDYLSKVGFSEIHILMYLRDPARYYISSAQQALKKQYRMPLPQSFQYPMLEAIDRWLNISPNSFTVKEFSTMSLLEGDVVKDFEQYLSTVGIDAKLNIDRPLNETMCSEVVQAIQDCYRYLSNDLINEEDRAEKISRIRKLIRCRDISGSKPKLKISIERHIHHRFLAELQVLHSRYGIFEKLLADLRRSTEIEIAIDLPGVSLFRELVDHFDNNVLLKIKADHLDMKDLSVECDRSIHPYKTQPRKAFWKCSVPMRETIEMRDIWIPKWRITHKTPLATVGSCFAQHISKALQVHGCNWVNGEQGPHGMTVESLRKYNYGIFSFRTGNIYTIALLKQWLLWALDNEQPPQEFWLQNNRYFDPFRPEVEPNGFSSKDELLFSRKQTLDAIKSVLVKSKILVFTLGLTEGWINAHNGCIYPYCPGTQKGNYDPSIHRYKNFNFQELQSDLLSVISLAKSVNKGLRFLLTVSPVPLIATASNHHILVANQYSKSVLRAVAGDLSTLRRDVDYFPSYELIASHPFGDRYYDANLRAVTDDGVAWVMRHFFAALNIGIDTPDLKAESNQPKVNVSKTVSDTVCEEELLAQFESSVNGNT